MKIPRALDKLKKALDQQVPDQVRTGRTEMGKSKGEKLAKSKYTFLWRTADKRWLALEEMDDSHLVNSLRMLAKSSRGTKRPMDRRGFKLIKEIQGRKISGWQWKVAEDGFIGYTGKMNLYMTDKCPTCGSYAWKVIKDSSQNDRMQCSTGDYTAPLETTVGVIWDPFDDSWDDPFQPVREVGGKGMFYPTGIVITTQKNRSEVKAKAKPKEEPNPYARAIDLED